MSSEAKFLDRMQMEREIRARQLFEPFSFAKIKRILSDIAAKCTFRPASYEKEAEMIIRKNALKEQKDNIWNCFQMDIHFLRQDIKNQAIPLTQEEKESIKQCDNEAWHLYWIREELTPEELQSRCDKLYGILSRIVKSHNCQN